MCRCSHVLLHNIECVFATTAEICDTIYENKCAGVSMMTITISSSFQTVLPQIMGKAFIQHGRRCMPHFVMSTKYSEWFDNLEGIPTGIKPRIEEGLATQKTVYEEAICSISYTYPIRLVMTSQLLQHSYDLT
jgi:hypothetical protein